MKKLYLSMMAGLITTCLYADPVDLQQAKAIAAGFMANGQQPTLVNSNALTRNGKSLALALRRPK